MMVWYTGSKRAHADEMLSIMMAKRCGRPWVECFVGGGNVICRVPHEEGPRLGADKNPYMVALLDGLGNRGWLPPSVMTETEYEKIKKYPDQHSSELVAFAATGLTFGCKWFDAYVKEEGRIIAAREACLRDAPGLRGAKFIVSEYDKLTIPPDSIVYCDPPYAGTTEYKGSKTKIAVGESLAKNAWDRVKFWRWADAQVEAGHKVFVSEYAGPPTSAYRITDATLKDEASAIAAIGKILRDREAGPLTSRPTDDERSSLEARATELALRERAWREAQVARWKIVWQKEVVSDFSSVREAGVREGKRETELLLTRT